MKLSSLIGSRAVILVGGVIAISLTFMSTYTVNVSAFFALYAVGFGIGKGFMYPAPLRAGWSHLPGRKGFVSGIVVSGLGFGAFAFGVMASAIVNPKDLPPSPVLVAPGVYEQYFPAEVNQRVPMMIIIFCAIWTVLILVGLLTVSNFISDGVSSEVHQLEEPLQPGRAVPI